MRENLTLRERVCCCIFVVLMFSYAPLYLFLWLSQVVVRKFKPDFHW